MLWSSQYAVPHLISIAASIGMLVAAQRAPRLARILYVALFAWACTINWQTALGTPEVYLEYAPLAIVPLYRDLILGPFAAHVLPIVGTIGTCQGLIALGVFTGGVPARVALAGALLFLVAIAPLGVGSGFPSTLIMAFGAWKLLQNTSALRFNLVRAFRPA